MENVYGNLNDNGDKIEYEFVDEPFEERYDGPKFDQKDLLSIQALAMNIHKTARTRINDESRRVYGFSAVQNMLTDRDALYDGTQEEYLSFRVEKPEFDRWQMRVRFRRNLLTPETATQLEEEDYILRWSKTGGHMGRYVYQHVQSTPDVGIKYTVNEARPLDRDDLAVLRKRMELHHAMYAGKTNQDEAAAA